MQSFFRGFLSVRRHILSSSKIISHKSTRVYPGSITHGLSIQEPNYPVLYGVDAPCFTGYSNGNLLPSHPRLTFWAPLALQSKVGFQAEMVTPEQQVVHNFCSRGMTTAGSPAASHTAPNDVAPRIKFKRLDKTAKHIMQILDKEAVEEVRSQREIPDIKPGYIIQLKVVVPENKRRVSTLKGIVIARRNAGLNTTFRLRRLVAGVGVESLFPLYSPNIMEIKVLDKKKVRRAKLYYLRDRMNALKKQ